jgi:hypothetical protein
MRISMAGILVLGIAVAQTASAVDLGLDAANPHPPHEASILNGEPVGTDTIVPAGELDLAISDRGDSTAATLKGCVVLAAVAAGFLAYRVHASNQRMVALLRQQAMDDALLAAMNRDFEAAQTAIQRAELLQASPECIRMLYGEVALREGQAAEPAEAPSRPRPRRQAPAGAAPWAHSAGGAEEAGASDSTRPNSLSSPVLAALS